MAPGHFGYPIGDFFVYGWSISGNETAIGVKTRGLFALFDVGIAPSCHGHIDHIGAICQHMRKRELNNVGPATYYLLPHLIEPVKALCRAYSELQGCGMGHMYEPKLMEMIPGSRIQIESKWWVESFQTDHVVPSLGYILLYQDFKTTELIPEIAYTGDTRFTIFSLPAHPKLLQVKLLITESTYLDGNNRSRENSQKYGHICITDFAINSRLFRDVGAIFLMHFSDRYSLQMIKDKVYCSLPEDLAEKVYCSLTAKKALKVEHSAEPLIP
nr:nuclear ribonuclease Z [Hymenolepis microstoma]